MIIQHLSASGYNTVDHCQMKWFIGSVLKWRFPSPWKATDIGTICHTILEVLANAKLHKQNGKGRYEDEQIGTVTYSKLFDDSYLEKIIEKCYYKHLEIATQHDWNEKDLKTVKKHINTAITYNDGHYNPLNLDIVGSEIEFNPVINEEWAKYSYELDGRKIEGKLALRGFIDLVVKVDDSTYEVVDWKSGSRNDFNTGKLKEYDDLVDDIQLRMYHYAVTLLYPDIENVLVTIYYIKAGGPFTICYSKDDIPKTLDMIKTKFEKVRDTPIPSKNVTWQCRKSCEYGMNSFEGTEIPVITSNKKTHCCNKGESHKICSQVDYILQHRSMDSVIKNLSKPSSTLLKENQ
jgi:hypothetical protein